MRMYCRPKDEQPEKLIDHYDGNLKRLKQLGMACDIVPGMHEKIAIIDDEII